MLKDVLDEMAKSGAIRSCALLVYAVYVRFTVYSKIAKRLLQMFAVRAFHVFSRRIRWVLGLIKFHLQKWHFRLSVKWDFLNPFKNIKWTLIETFLTIFNYWGVFDASRWFYAPRNSREAPQKQKWILKKKNCNRSWRWECALLKLVLFSFEHTVHKLATHCQMWVSDSSNSIMSRPPFSLALVSPRKCDRARYFSATSDQPLFWTEAIAHCTVQSVFILPKNEIFSLVATLCSDRIQRYTE